MPIVKMAVPDFPGYWVGSNGSVWSKWEIRRNGNGRRGVYVVPSDAEIPVEITVNKNGYSSVSLRKNGRAHRFALHRLVCEVFHGPCSAGMECRHLDGNKGNNRPSNLAWGTRLENEADKVRHGTHRTGTEAAALINRGRKRTFTEEHKQNIKKAAQQRDPEHTAKLSGDNHWTKRSSGAEIVASTAEKLRGRELTEEHKQAIAEGLQRAYDEGRR